MIIMLGGRKESIFLANFVHPIVSSVPENVLEIAIERPQPCQPPNSSFLISTILRTNQEPNLVICKMWHSNFNSFKWQFS